MKSNILIRIEDASGAGEARRQAAALARSMGLSDEDSGKIAIIVTESATNIARHAGRGAILIRALERDGRVGVELTAVDTGPGIANIGQAMEDGFSTGGTAGNGLGALKRLPTWFDIHSSSTDGTALCAHIWSAARPVGLNDAGFDFGVVNIPKPGQDICGDSWAIDERPGRSLFMVVDGLGHGAEAALASAAAVRAFHDNADHGAGDILDAIHAALHATRGAAVAVAEVFASDGNVKFAGLGNISGTLHVNGEVRHMVSHDGTAGHNARRMSEFNYPWTKDTLLLMHSDGLSRRFSLSDRAGLSSRHPSIITAVLYAHHCRHTDDVTILAARQAR